VRASLDLVECVATLQAEEPLAVRIGIATGPVVVGKTGDGDASVPKLAVGETPNLAARLQSLAEANAIVISPSTKALVREKFSFRELGNHELKGIAGTVEATVVVALVDEADGDSDIIRPALPVLVGRDEEIGLLRRAWQQSKEGLGQAVLLNGEPGIGKSSLVEILYADLREEGAPRLLLRCSEYHQNSAMYPVIEHVKKLMDWKSDDTPEIHQSKLERMLDNYSQPKAEAVPLLASFLSVSLPDGRYPPLKYSPEELKQNILDILVAWLLEEAERRATVILCEDLHWADPSTLEFVGLLLDQAPTSSLLILLTFRPDFEPPWRTRSHMTPITLARLERPQIEVLVKRHANGKDVPQEVMEYVVRKTDGVPLYVEELTKTLINSGVLRETAERYELDGPLSSVAIPATLQESLMARLDRLPTVREVAQLGSVLGREFDYELLEGIGLIEESALHEGLKQLVAEELLYQRGRGPRAKYMFKHALVQDAAYQSLLRRNRQQYHGQIAQLIEQRFPDQVESEPEILAFHYTGAGRTAEAITYWRRAGKLAIDHYANAEAVAHLKTGLGLLKDLPDDAERTTLELEMRMDLVACMRILDRYEEALENLDRMETIATELDRAEELALIHNYRGNIYFPLGEFEKCLAQHELAIDHARRAGAVEQEAQALSGMGDAYYDHGAMLKSLENFQRCMDFCTEHGLTRIKAKNGLMVAWIRQYTNDFSGAAVAAKAAVDAAVEVGDRRAEIVARTVAGHPLSHLGDVEAARAQVKAGLAAVEVVGARRFLPHFAIIENRIGLIEGAPRAELAKAMEDALHVAHETGVKFLGPWVLSSLALVCDDPVGRRKALADGEALLAAGCVGHNYFGFYAEAIEISLDENAWDETDRYCAALAEYTRAEPLPYSDFCIAYGRALAAFGRGERDAATGDILKGLRDEAVRAGLVRWIPRLDHALEESGPGVRSAM